MTLSGGEPAQQAEFSVALLARLPQRGIHTALETSGHAPWEALEALAGVTDLVLFDLKHMDSDAHRRLTGVDERGHPRQPRRVSPRFTSGIHVRVPCITGVNDDEPHIGRLAAFVAGLGIREAHAPSVQCRGRRQVPLDRPRLSAQRDLDAERRDHAVPRRSRPRMRPRGLGRGIAPGGSQWQSQHRHGSSAGELASAVHTATASSGSTPFSATA